MKNIFIGIGLTSLLAFVAINFFTQGRAETSARADITVLKVDLTQLRMDKRRLELFSDLTEKKNADTLIVVETQIADKEKTLAAMVEKKDQINSDTESQRQDANDAAATIDAQLGSK